MRPFEFSLSLLLLTIYHADILPVQSSTTRSNTSYASLPIAFPSFHLSSIRSTSVSLSSLTCLSHSVLTALSNRVDFFDTADYVSRLESQGLNRKQAEGVVDALEDIIGEAISNLQGNLVTRTEHYKHHDRQKVSLALSLFNFCTKNPVYSSV